MATTLNLDTRPSFQDIFMAMAHLVARRSTCERLQVGTIIASTDFRYVYAFGYNGNYSGGPNTCDKEGEGVCGCLHSEENAIINCTVDRSTPKVIFLTHGPCIMCAKRIINLGGVHAIYFNTPYRNNDGIKLLQTADIFVKCTREGKLP